MIRCWLVRVLLVAGVCTFNPVRAQIFTAPNGCSWYSSSSSTFNYSGATLVIPVSASPGDFLTDWQLSSPSLWGSVWMGFPFYACAARNVVRNNPTDENDNLYVQGVKPAGVHVSTDLPTADGYTVWTTNQLSAIGVGFILRWRVHTQNSAGLTGAWNSPDAAWTTHVPPPAAGLPFYRFASEIWPPTIWTNPIGGDGFSSVDAYRVALDGVPAQSSNQRNEVYFYYGAQLAVRYVLIKPTNLIYDQLDLKTGSVIADFITLRSRPNTHQVNSAVIKQTISYKLPPLKTCETPTAAEATVNFAPVFSTDFPNNQWGVAAYQDFPLTFRNCPRVPIRYYVHANGNRWVDSVRGVVGVQDSIPGAPNPVAGNPRGFAIQLQHRSGGHQHNGNVHIHPQDMGSNAVNVNPGYTRTHTGAGTSNNPSTGITHTIPMRASLVRTGHSSQQSVQPGAFNASVVVVISYP